MGKHDREHRGDGEWPKDKPLPKDALRDDWKDDSGSHSAGKQEAGRQDDDEQDDEK